MWRTQLLPGLCASKTVKVMYFNFISFWFEQILQDGISSCHQLMKQIAINSNVKRKQPLILSQQRVMPGVRVEFTSLSSAPPSRRRKREERDAMVTQKEICLWFLSISQIHGYNICSLQSFGLNLQINMCRN